jgi:hypothetical protein
MTALHDLTAWLATLAPDSSVAVDEGGLALVEIDSRGELTGAYLEVGGVPEITLPISWVAEMPAKADGGLA